MKIAFAALVCSSVLLASCGNPQKNAEVLGWGDATDQPKPTPTPNPNKCTPFYTSVQTFDLIIKWNVSCDSENKRHFKFGYANATVPSTLSIKSTDYPTHTTQLDKIFEYQFKNGVDFKYLKLLEGDVKELLKKGDPESVKQAHKIYFDFLLNTPLE